jgi:hypothetical protein
MNTEGNAYTIVVASPQGKGSSGICRRTGEDNIKMDLIEVVLYFRIYIASQPGRPRLKLYRSTHLTQIKKRPKGRLKENIH